MLQEGVQHRQKMLCANCGPFMGRDIVAAMNMSCKPSPRLGTVEMA